MKWEDAREKMVAWFQESENPKELGRILAKALRREPLTHSECSPQLTKLYDLASTMIREGDAHNVSDFIEKERFLPDIKLTPEQEIEGWEIKYQGGMWVKTFDIRKTADPAYNQKLVNHYKAMIADQAVKAYISRQENYEHMELSSMLLLGDNLDHLDALAHICNGGVPTDRADILVDLAKLGALTTEDGKVIPTLLGSEIISNLNRKNLL